MLNSSGCKAVTFVNDPSTQDLNGCYPKTAINRVAVTTNMISVNMTCIDELTGKRSELKSTASVTPSGVPCVTPSGAPCETPSEVLGVTPSGVLCETPSEVLCVTPSGVPCVILALPQCVLSYNIG